MFLRLFKSLVVYRLVHPPVTRESGVRLPARETSFCFSCFVTSENPPIRNPGYRRILFLAAPTQTTARALSRTNCTLGRASRSSLRPVKRPGLSEPLRFRQFQPVPPPSYAVRSFKVTAPCQQTAQGETALSDSSPRPLYQPFRHREATMTS